MLLINKEATYRNWEDNPILVGWRQAIYTLKIRIVKLSNPSIMNYSLLEIDIFI